MWLSYAHGGKMEEIIRVYCDGACRNNGDNGALGAYAFVIDYGCRKSTEAKAILNTTNNKMELTAAIKALIALSLVDYGKQNKIEVYTDSQYVVKGVNEWSIKWIANDFHKVKNADLWKTLLSLIKTFKDISFNWVKGHSDNIGNIEVDSLCNAVMDNWENEHDK